MQTPTVKLLSSLPNAHTKPVSSVPNAHTRPAK
jgi:hypothetical protein